MELGHPLASIFIFSWALHSLHIWASGESQSVTFLPVLQGILLMPSKKEVLKMLSSEGRMKKPAVQEAGDSGVDTKF